MNWYKQYETDLGFYDYKGHSVSTKTEKEKMAMAEKHKSEHYLNMYQNTLSKYFFILISDTEEYVDALEAQEMAEKNIIVKEQPSYFLTRKKTKRKDIHNTIMQSVSSFVNQNKVRKKAFIKSIVELNPDISELVIKRRIRKLFKQRFIEIDKTFKTKPFVIKGHYWREIC
tara:strand:- start:63 stop:575 length:513 start_codon:yes stop_codon:yes gene_type:complete